MKKSIIWIISLLAILFVSSVAETNMGNTFGKPANPPDVFIALVGGTIYVDPAKEPIRDGVVLIQGNKIIGVGTRAQVKIPPGTQTLDCKGFTITAGFWNSHVHFFERKWADAANIPASDLNRQLQDMLTRFGFTSVFDIGSMWTNTRAIRIRIEHGEVTGPRIRSTGEAMVPVGALPSDTVLAVMGVMKFPAPEIADAAQASAATRKQLDADVDGIKLFASSQRGAPFPEGGMQAAVAEAHRAGKPVFVHTNTGADVLAAARAGVDIIAHTTPSSGSWDETILAAMKEHRVALTPTLTIWKYYARHDNISAQDKIVNTELGQLRAWLARGGTVLFGNDLGAVDYDPSEEYALMKQAGMSFRQILASLTTAPAEKFGDSERLGRVAAGLDADIVVLKGDPAKDIRSLTAVLYTLRDGKIIYRATN